MATVESHAISVDDFIKFTVSDSPARHGHLGGDMSNGGHYGSHVPSDPHSSPFPDQHSFGVGDSTEWLNNMGLESVLGVSTPSSRGSSLETPNLTQGSFMSIDPSRLKEASLGASYETDTNNSPVWIPGQSNQVQQHQQRQQQQQAMHHHQHQQHAHHHPHPPLLSCDTNIQPVSTRSSSTASPNDQGQYNKTPTMGSAVSVPTGTKRKRQGSLPELFIPAEPEQQHPHQPRALQRSVSTGAMIVTPEQQQQMQQQQQPQSGQAQHQEPPHQQQPGASNSPYLPQVSPTVGPMSAPPVSRHPQSFAPVPQPQQAPATAVPQNMPNRSFNASSLATIPEAPNSAPPDVQWTPIPHNQDDQSQQQSQSQPQQYQQQQSQPQQVFRYTSSSGDMATTYTMPMPPVAPSLPSPAMNASSPMMHSPMVATPSLPQNMVPRHLAHARSVSMSCVPMMTQVQPQFHQQQHQQQMQQQLPNQQHHPMQHQQQQASQMSAYTQHIPATAIGLSTPSHLGMGRPLHTPAHLRRSSDSELAFAMGHPSNVGAMLRSTSVPQVAGQAVRLNGSTVYGSAQHLPPPPPVTTYSAHNISGPYAESFVQTQHALGYGHPVMPGSPPRKRIASKRVGMCLKPGPKGKKIPKLPSPVPLTSLTSADATNDGMTDVPGGAAAGAFMVGGDFAGAGGLPDIKSAHRVPANLEPVTIEEFYQAFTRTPTGTLIPKPPSEMDPLVERLMYATDDSIVDQCFRWCYTIGTEFNRLAEKQSKYFKCCFEECAGINSRIFMRKSAVDSHVRTHVGYRPFRCEVDPECDARFVRKHDRDRHVATTHRNEKSYMCSDCGQNFARSDALLRHRAKRDACRARMG